MFDSLKISCVNDPSNVIFLYLVKNKNKYNLNVSSDTDAPTAATTFVITKGHNSCKNGRRKNSFLDDHLHILLNHLCKFVRNPPDSLGGVDATRFRACTYVRTYGWKYGQVQLYMALRGGIQANSVDQCTV
jgi:hypothetical protein